MQNDVELLTRIRGLDIPEQDLEPLNAYWQSLCDKQEQLARADITGEEVSMTFNPEIYHEQL